MRACMCAKAVCVEWPALPIYATFRLFGFVFLKQKTAYEMRISDWSSDVCSSDLERVSIWFETLVQGPCFEWWMLRRFKILRPGSVAVISAALGLKVGPSVCLFTIPQVALKHAHSPKPVSVRARGLISAVGDGVFRGGACTPPECGVAGGPLVHCYG